MKSESMQEHRNKSPSELKCGVITLSDSKFQAYQETSSTETDISGSILVKTLESKYTVLKYSIIPDDSLKLVSTLEDMINNQKVDIIITTGGTGIGSRDITVETLKNLFEKELNGFGEIFRYESYKELGSGAILSRATAGVYKKNINYSHAWFS